MARFHATPAALIRLRELRTACGLEKAVVAIYWTGPQADLLRRPDGSTEWRRLSEGEWHVGLDSRARFEGRPLDVIEDVEFFVNEFPKHESIDGRTLDYVDGGFRVA